MVAHNTALPFHRETIQYTGPMKYRSAVLCTTIYFATDCRLGVKKINKLPILIEPEHRIGQLVFHKLVLPDLIRYKNIHCEYETTNIKSIEFNRFKIEIDNFELRSNNISILYFPTVFLKKSNIRFLIKEIKDDKIQR